MSGIHSLPPQLDGPVLGDFELVLSSAKTSPPLNSQQQLKFQATWWGDAVPFTLRLGVKTSNNTAKKSFSIHCDTSSFHEYLKDVDTLTFSVHVDEINCDTPPKKLSIAGTPRHRVLENKRVSWTTGDLVGYCRVSQLKLNFRGELIQECPIINIFGNNCGFVTVALLFLERSQFCSKDASKGATEEKQIVPSSASSEKPKKRDICSEELPSCEEVMHQNPILSQSFESTFSSDESVMNYLRKIDPISLIECGALKKEDLPKFLQLVKDTAEGEASSSSAFESKEENRMLIENATAAIISGSQQRSSDFNLQLHSNACNVTDHTSLSTSRPSLSSFSTPHDANAETSYSAHSSFIEHVLCDERDEPETARGLNLQNSDFVKNAKTETPRYNFSPKKPSSQKPVGKEVSCSALQRIRSGSPRNQREETSYSYGGCDDARYQNSSSMHSQSSRLEKTSSRNEFTNLEASQQSPNLKKAIKYTAISAEGRQMSMYRDDVEKLTSSELNSQQFQSEYNYNISSLYSNFTSSNPNILQTVHPNNVLQTLQSVPSSQSSGTGKTPSNMVAPSDEELPCRDNVAGLAEDFENASFASDETYTTSTINALSNPITADKLSASPGSLLVLEVGDLTLSGLTNASSSSLKGVKDRSSVCLLTTITVRCPEQEEPEVVTLASRHLQNNKVHYDAVEVFSLSGLTSPEQLRTATLTIRIHRRVLGRRESEELCHSSLTLWQVYRLSYGNISLPLSPCIPLPPPPLTPRQTNLPSPLKSSRRAGRFAKENIREAGRKENARRKILEKVPVSGEINLFLKLFLNEQYMKQLKDSIIDNPSVLDSIIAADDNKQATNHETDRPLFEDSFIHGIARLEASAGTNERPSSKDCTKPHEAPGRKNVVQQPQQNFTEGTREKKDSKHLGSVEIPRQKNSKYDPLYSSSARNTKPLPSSSNYSSNNVTNPSNVSRSPSYEKSKPSYEKSNPSYEKSKPSYEKSTPSYEKSKPSYEKSKPSYENSNLSDCVSNQRSNPRKQELSLIGNPVEPSKPASLPSVPSCLSAAPLTELHAQSSLDPSVSFIQTLSQKYHQTTEYLMRIHVEVLQARQLSLVKDFSGSFIEPCPYVRATVFGTDVVTDVRQNDTCPQWNWSQDIIASSFHLNSSDACVIVRVLHKASSSPQHPLLGCLALTPPSPFWPGQVSLCGWYPLLDLRGQLAGHIKLSLTIVESLQHSSASALQALHSKTQCGDRPSARSFCGSTASSSQTVNHSCHLKRQTFFVSNNCAPSGNVLPDDNNSFISGVKEDFTRENQRDDNSNEYQHDDNSNEYQHDDNINEYQHDDNSNEYQHDDNVSLIGDIILPPPSTYANFSQSHFSYDASSASNDKLSKLSYGCLHPPQENEESQKFSTSDTGFGSSNSSCLLLSDNISITSCLKAVDSPRSMGKKVKFADQFSEKVYESRDCDLIDLEGDDNPPPSTPKLQGGELSFGEVNPSNPGGCAPIAEGRRDCSSANQLLASMSWMNIGKCDAPCVSFIENNTQASFNENNQASNENSRKKISRPKSRIAANLSRLKF